MRCLLHTACFACRTLQLLESSEQSEEPTTFEVGAGDIVGNRLFEVGATVCCLACVYDEHGGVLFHLLTAW